MDITSIIGGALLIILVGAIIGINIYNMKKSGTSITFDQFMSMYQEQILNVLKDSVEIISIDITSYEDKESYQNAIISLTIEKIKENASELGIDISILELFDSETLVSIVSSILSTNLVEVFSSLKSEFITANSSMYDEEVITVLTEA